MSEEAAFLAAIKTNPADDVARLVYADWLDDHDQHAKAEYLRALTALTQISGGTPPYTDSAGQLFLACARTQADWRRAAGGRFDVMLDGYEPPFKIRTIKIVRELTGFGLAEAKALVESVPTPLFSWLPFEEALPRLLAFDAPVGTDGSPNLIRACIRPTPWPEGASGAVFDVLLSAIDLHPNGSMADVQQGYLVRGLASVLDLSEDRVLEMVSALPIVLASGISGARVAEFVRSVNRSCNTYRIFPPGAIRVVPRT